MEHQVLELDSVMGFGKHKHRSLEYVLENFPEYIDWMLENTERPISEEAYQYQAHLKG